jgi:3-phosphoshikimate 1-carboxyvinyltransferase
MGKELRLQPLGQLSGRLAVPGDKSISHRALMLGAIACGRSRIAGLSSGEDVRTTRRVMERLGVAITDEDDELVIDGKGWSAPDRPGREPLALDCGNSGTTARLLLGLLAAREGRFRLEGDASLSGRPMGRVVRPLSRLGATITGGETLPLTVEGRPLRGGSLRTGVPSAQVKSALMLAALQADGESTIEEADPTRDHTERLLAAMGAPVTPTGSERNGWAVRGGCAPLDPLRLRVPGDPSSAAFLVALAACLPGSRLLVEGVSVNPTRLGFYRLLRRMGADIGWDAEILSPEPVGRIDVRGSRLHGVDCGPGDIPGAVDEIPLLAVVAAVSEGTTTIRGAGELRHKESDRLAATAAMLRAFGARVDEQQDGLHIEGSGGLSAGKVEARGDHRIAMSAAVAASLADGPSVIAGHEWVRISYPDFFHDLARLGSGASQPSTTS